MTRVRITYTANLAGITFWVEPSERRRLELGKRGRGRIFIGADGGTVPTLEDITNDLQRKSIATLLTTIPNDEVDPEFVEFS
jgi:hypothetical protein